jgi:putative glycosyltransferase (TIGR04348 family)
MDMGRLFLVTPAAANARNGNRHTAARWGAMLRAAGFRVRIAQEWSGEPCDALIALHARRSHSSIVSFKDTEKPLIVVLTGTDLYRDLPDSSEARDSLELAERVIVLQDAALRELEPHVRRKAAVVYQSSDCALKHAPPRNAFRISVVGHLRAEKDPFRSVAALALLPAENKMEIVHIGGALDPDLGQEAKAWMAREPRYRWLGSLSHGRALRWIASSHLVVHSSVMEGGANVIVEAARIRTPVLASRVSGNVGMLGSTYPGFYPVFDEVSLSKLISRAAHRPEYYRTLRKALDQRRPLFASSAERRALVNVVRSAFKP